MKVDVKFVQENKALYRQFGVTALHPAVIEALFVVAELSLGDIEPAAFDDTNLIIGEDIPAPADKPARKPRSKVA